MTDHRPTPPAGAEGDAPTEAGEGRDLQRRRRFVAAVWRGLGRDPATVTGVLRCNLSWREDGFDDGDVDNLLIDLADFAVDEEPLISLVFDGGGAGWAADAYRLGDGFLYVVEHGDDEDDSLVAVAPEAQREALFREVQAEEAGMLGVFPSEWWARALVAAIHQYQLGPEVPEWEPEGVDEKTARLWRGYVAGDPADPDAPPGLTSRDDPSPAFARWLEGVTLRWRDTGEPVAHPETPRLVCQYLAR